METTNIRSIVPSVSNPRASSSSTLLKRERRSLDYAKANQAWWIEVEFNSDADTMIFEKCLEGSSIRLVEFEGKFYIEDPRIPDGAPMDEPFRYAKEELPRLNAAVKVTCPHFVPVRFSCAVQLSAEGYGKSIVSTEVFLHGPEEQKAILSFLKGPPTEFSAIMELSARNADVREALYYFGTQGNLWADLYKVLEIIEDYCGGKEQLLSRRWCSRSSWERFKQTANHQEAIGRFSRHARAKVVPPSKPMKEKELRAFTWELLHKWLQELLSKQAPLDRQ